MKKPDLKTMTTHSILNADPSTFKTVPDNIDLQLAKLITESHDPSIPVRQKITALSNMIARLIWENDFPASSIITATEIMTDFTQGLRERLTGLFAEHFEETGRDPLSAEHNVYRFLSLIQGEIAYARSAGKAFPDGVVEEVLEKVLKKSSENNQS